MESDLIKNLTSHALLRFLNDYATEISTDQADLLKLGFFHST